jgi:hypothetical protein
MKRLFFLTVSLMLATQIFTESFDWPQWRGPNSNGVSSETDWNLLALKNGARVLWTADIGAGYSNIAIQGNRVYAIGKDQKTWKLIFSCIDAVTGKTIWEKKDLETAGEVMATPAVDGDRVYGIGGDGMLFCLQTTDGRLLWQKDLRNDYHLVFFGVAVSPSPIVEGDLILINANDAGAAPASWCGLAGTRTSTGRYFTVLPYRSISRGNGWCSSRVLKPSASWSRQRATCSGGAFMAGRNPSPTPSSRTAWSSSSWMPGSFLVLTSQRPERRCTFRPARYSHSGRKPTCSAPWQARCR